MENASPMSRSTGKIPKIEGDGEKKEWEYLPVYRRDENSFG